MKLKSLYIDYFMSFGPGNEIPLADRGLVLINGINEISDSASSNGAGKTNLQEALLWAFFGETTKGVPVNNVVNNIHGKDCLVRVILEDGEIIYYIERYRKHSEHGDDLLFYRITPDGKESLAGVDKAETQKRIEQFLGCGFTLFCNSSYFSQVNVKPFSTYTDKQIKEVFIDALDMNRFTGKALEKIRLDLKTLREELATIQGRRLRLNEEIEEAEKRKTEYQLKHTGFADEQKKELTKLDEQINTTLRQIGSLKSRTTEIDTINTAIAEHEKTVAKLPENLDIQRKLKATVDRFRDSFNLIQHKAADAKRQADTKNKEMVQASSRIGTNCTECGKPIIEEDLAGVITGIRSQIDAVSADLAKYTDLTVKAKPVLEKYQTEETAINSEIAACQKAEKMIAELKISLSRIEASKREIFVLETNLKALEAAKLKKAEEKSPWEDYIEKEQTTIDEAQVKVKTLDEVVAGKQEEIKYVEYWEVGFGYSGIPSFLLDTVTPFLNEQANHHSTTVTGGEIEIDFSTVTKTKKGELKDKFQINISHKSGAKGYKGTSGGERKRADVCIAQSIQDLVRSFGRNTLSYCSYDEPFENLDGEGVGNVVNMLQEIAKTIGTVLVVTHNDELKALFDNTITVIKGKDGYSRIVA